MLAVEDAALRHAKPLDGYRELLGSFVEQERFQPPRRLDRGVSGHERDPARVAPEIDGSQMGVGRDDVHVRDFDPELFRHDVGEDRIRSLADVGRAAESGDAAAAIELELHAAVRELVPVDGKARAGDVARGGEADAASAAKLPVLLPNSERSATRSRHSFRPTVLSSSWFAVIEKGIDDALEPEIERALLQLAPRSCRGGTRWHSEAGRSRGPASARRAACS